MNSNPVMNTAGDVRLRESFDFGWKFQTGVFPEAEYAEFDDSSWENVQLPHDYCIEQDFKWRRHGGPNAFLPLIKGCYRKKFRVPAAFSGKRISILFDGVFQRAAVFLNGEQIGCHAYGFTPFELDITSKVNPEKENILTVTVDPADACRWYSGSGIYRHVHLLATGTVHVATWGTYVTTPEISGKRAQIEVVTTLRNDSGRETEAEIRQTIFDPEGRTVTELPPRTVKIDAGQSCDVTHSGEVAAPQLWDIDAPWLYSVVTAVRISGRTVDEHTTRFGIRSIRFGTDGFLLNGRPVKFKGICLHQDAGPLGAAVPDRSYERRLEILKEYGVNAIRCSHNPPSPEFLDLCDRMGFLVIDEAFDKWKAGYYRKIFDASWQEDMKAMLLRDRNHPSIVIWSIGNEVTEVKDESGEGLKRAQMLHEFVKAFEPTRPTILALQYRFLQEYADVTDLIGYNYLERQVLEDHQRKPQRKFIITEALQYYSSLVGNSFRGVEERNPWNFVLENDFILGSFIWTGVDYLGESVHYPSKGWPCAPFDSCMNEKPFGAYHRSFWNSGPLLKVAAVDNSLDYDPGKDLWQFPNMVRHWNLPYRDGRMVELRVISNYPWTELLINGRSVGARDRSHFRDNATSWFIAYQPGVVEVRGYDEAGKLMETDRIVTAGKATVLQLTPDRGTIVADGQDLVHIRAELFDNDGNPVQVDDRELTVKTEGEGRFRGIDNGDLRRKVNFTSGTLSTRLGKALVVVQSSRNPGKIRVFVSAKGINEPAVAEIDTE